MINSLDDLSEEILRRSHKLNFDLRGPAETSLGYPWPPTISFWTDNRRIHFYFEKNKDSLSVEVVSVNPKSDVLMGSLQTVDEAWEIINRFLREHCTFDELPNCSWEINSYDSDKFIPHPPDQYNPANIASVLQQPGWTKWKPPQTAKPSQNRLQKFQRIVFRLFRLNANR